MDAIFYCYEQTSTSYREFCRLVAGRKQTLAFLSGETVGLWCDNHPDFIVDLFALWAVGAVPFVISRRMPWEAVCELLETGKASALLTSDLDRCTSSPVPVWRSGLTAAPDTELIADLPAIGPGMPGVALILHTSGTTSRPKLVRLTRDNLEASLRFDQARWQGIWSPHEVALGWLPLFHSFGLISELLHIYRSKSQYHFARPEPEALLTALESGRITTLSAVPWMLERLVELPGGSRALGQLRWVVVGGAPLSDELRERLVEAGVTVVQQYGMTELGAVFRGIPGGDPRDMSPIIPEEYFQLEQGTGQLVIDERCPALAELGPFATRDAFDLAAAGQYRFRHRLDDVLVHVSGEKSNAASIEALLRSRLQAQIQQLSVVGAGRLQLACVLQWKQEPSSADRRALLDAFDAVNAELPRHSRLDIDLVVDVGPEQQHRFPLSPKGTIVRSLLEREFEREITACYQGALGPAAWPVARVAALGTLSREAALSELASLIQELAARLRRQRIDPLLGFAEQGFDSLQALMMRLRLGRTLGIELSPSLLFDYPNVTRLAEQLYELSVGSAPAANSDRGAPLEVDEPIAIVGAACRFPGGASGLAAFWRTLLEQRVSVCEIPAERWNVDDWYDPDPDALGRSSVRRASLIEDIAAFDAAFFRISPREATSLDPQQRLLLETTWEALEHACIDPTTLRHTATGVFVGMSATDFAERVDMRDPSAAYAATGSAASIAAGRISYTLGLHGPSLAVDTACSSSLSAIHLACQSLRRGECGHAVVGAVNLLLSPRTFASLSRLHVLAPDGCCKPFAASADGFGRGEGCGAVVLMRLADAQKQGAPILAVIRGSAMNNDGPSSGLTVPNGPAQQSLVRTALARAGIAAADIDYVECHGTGTLLGDPIEVQALGAVFSERNADSPLRIGAVKANLGHLEAAAGFAGLLKVVLCLEHEQLVAQPHFESLNPHVPWAQLPLRVLREFEPWRRSERPRRAGISSFGLGGTNVHVIVEEAPPPVVRAPASVTATASPLLAFPISARSAEALRKSAANLTTALQERPNLRLEDLAYSLCSTRSAFEHRALISARTREELGAALLALQNAENHPQLVQGSGSLTPRIGLLFPGQGSQRAQMGRALYETYAVFRESLDATFAAFSAHLAQPLQAVMFAAPGTAESALLDQTLYTQPALFSLEVALFRTVEAWGIRPSMLLGHSLGELAAAHVAGVLNLADACRLVAARARLMHAVTTVGAMLAIEAAEAEVQARLAQAPSLDLAAVNGPRACVVAGNVGPIEDFQAYFQALGRLTSRLQVSLAGHSSHMDPMLAEFEQVALTCTYAPPSMPIVSNVTGKVADPAVVASARYWVDQLRRTVRFADGVATLVAEDIDFCLELGPHGTLTALAGGCVESLPEAKQARVRFQAALSRSRAEPEALLNALAQLHCAGAPIDWAKLMAPYGGRSVRLPTYPFTRARFWPTPSSSSDRPNSGGGHPLLGKPLELASGEVLYTAQFGNGQPRWAGGHQIFGRATLPGTAFLEMALSAGREHGRAAIEELTLDRPLEIPERSLVELQVRVGAADAQGRRTITFHARDPRSSAAWTLHARGVLRPSLATSTQAPLATWLPVDAAPVSIQRLYEGLAERGYAYSGAFRSITGVWQRQSELWVEAALPAAAQHEGTRYGLHPALLDSVLHALATSAGGERFALPFTWSEVTLGAPGTPRLFAHITLTGEDRVCLELWNERREPLGTVKGLLLRVPSEPTDRSRDAAPEPARSLDWIPLTGSEVPGAPLILERGADAAFLAHTLARLTNPPTEVALLCWGSESAALETAHSESKRVLAVLQRWMQEPRLESSRLLIVTSRAVATAQDEDVPDLGHAALWGLVKSAQTEFPHRFVLVDVDDTQEPALLHSLSLARAHFQLESQVAIRHGRALAPRVVVAAQVPEPPARPAFPGHGTVLVTGAMGTIGGLVAEHLVVAHGVKHLLLCSRRPLDEELGRLLTAKGAEVQFVQCDIGDRDAVQALLNQIPKERPLVAVVHTAAAARDAVLADHGPDHIEKTFRGKLDGAWHLHELTQHLPLSAFVLFSSIAGVLGGPGQASYSAANTFLDALAHHRRARGLVALSMAWGLWAERSGLTRHLRDTIISRMARDGVLPLSTQHALALMDASLRQSAPLRIAARLDLNALESVGPALPPILRQLVGAQAPVAAEFTELLRGLPEAEAEARLVALIRVHAAQVLGVSENNIDDAQPMIDLGLDSVMAVELRNRLGIAIGRRLAPKLLFRFPSPRVLAERIRESVLDSAS